MSICRLCLIGLVTVSLFLSQVKFVSAAIYWGAYISGSHYGSSYGNAPWDTNTWDLFESHSGKKISILHWGQAWHWSNQPGYAGILDGKYQKFYSSDFDKVRQRGAIPFLDWGSWSLDSGGSTNQPTFSLKNIINGNFDGFVRQWATDAKNWGHPLFLRFDWEMNGSWFPWSELVNGNSTGQFVQAWRHIHDIFSQVGANNVTWVWCPNIIYSGSVQLSALYPGDNFVDWICLDGYNWGTNNPTHPDIWRSFYQVFKSSYDTVTAIAPNKPLIIGETASSEFGGSKATWINDMLTVELPNNLSKVQGFLWFNWNTDNAGWVIETSTTSRQAFATGISSNYYAANDFSNLNIFPIPILSQSPLQSTPTITSTRTPTPVQATNPAQPTGTPTPLPNCPLIIFGDANCDSRFDLVDFEIWRREFTGSSSTRNADYNTDGLVNLIDFEIWRRSFTGV